METTTTTTPRLRRLQSAGIPRSPRMSRSNSRASSPLTSDIRSLTSISSQESTNRASSVSLPEIRGLQQSPSRASRSATTSPRPSFHRSRSTTKSRNTTKEKDKNEENYKSIPISEVLKSPQRNLSLDKIRDHDNNMSPLNVAKLLRTSSHNTAIKRLGLKSSTGSPPAWALSPRRSSVPPLAPESPKVKGVSGVLKYFNKQKKVSPTQEEEFHQYRVMYNRQLQWRFTNAKAEAANAKVRTKAEGKLFGVWLKLYKMRYAIAEKRMKVERLKQKIKFLEIVSPQIELLNEWDKLEKKNSEAVGRVTRKLSAYSTKLPLVHGATGDIVAVFDAMRLALEVMEDMEETIINLQFQAEKVCNLQRELIHTVDQNIESFQELQKEITTVMSLEAQEKSLVVHLIQANKEPEEGQRNCKHHLMKSFRNKEIGLVFSMLNVS